MAITSLDMTEWWTALDDAIVACLEAGARNPAEIGLRLGMSEAAASSVLSLLAREGRIRIALVELPRVPCGEAGVR